MYVLTIMSKKRKSNVDRGQRLLSFGSSSLTLTTDRPTTTCSSEEEDDDDTATPQKRRGKLEDVWRNFLAKKTFLASC